MGKTFVILECGPIYNQYGRGYVPIYANKRDDETWIDPRHVIDGDRLRYDVPASGEAIFNPRHSETWQKVGRSGSAQCLILDPPPSGGDTWLSWLNEAPPSVDPKTLAWVRKMPRREP